MRTNLFLSDCFPALLPVVVERRAIAKIRQDAALGYKKTRRVARRVSKRLLVAAFSRGEEEGTPAGDAHPLVFRLGFRKIPRSAVSFSLIARSMSANRSAWRSASTACSRSAALIGNAR